MKFSIVTPSFDRPEFLDATIESVVSQAGDFEIDYVIQQASENSEVESILARWERKLGGGGYASKCRALRFRVFRESDNGMYDGINRGFAKTDGDVMAWINSDDIYHPGAFAAVEEIFRTYPQVYWLVGIPNAINTYGTLTGYDAFPRAYSREFISRGLHRGENHRFRLNWIPQDSTFWRRDLWEAVGGRLNASLRYAADFQLWQSFAKHAELVKVQAMLGAYRFHGAQITAEPKRYLAEIGPPPPVPFGWKLLATLQRASPLTESIVFGKRITPRILRLLGLRWEWSVAHTAVWSYSEQRWALYLNPVL